MRDDARQNANSQEADHNLKPNQWFVQTHDLVACVCSPGFIMKPSRFDFDAITVVFCRGGEVFAALNVRTHEHRHAQNQQNRKNKHDPSPWKQDRK
jgi:hypothetical protein